jgi:hypothetical protein
VVTLERRLKMRECVIEIFRMINHLLGNCCGRKAALMLISAIDFLKHLVYPEHEPLFYCVYSATVSDVPFLISC